MAKRSRMGNRDRARQSRRIVLVTPAAAVASGNQVTALRYAAILRHIGYEVNLLHEYDGRPCDVLIALHARKSAASIGLFRKQFPGHPLILVLTGTDLYKDLDRSAKARASLDLASRLVVLQRMALKRIPAAFTAKAEIIYQSARPVQRRTPPSRCFLVSVVGNLRHEKDPLRAALAARTLPLDSRVKFVHAGAAYDPYLANRARSESSRNGRYRWLEGIPHWKARRLIASSHLLAITSRMEGSSNVLSEAIACGVPVVASRIEGLVGTLGPDYPGYFRAGNTRELADIVLRAERDSGFYRELQTWNTRLAPLANPDRERVAWARLLKKVITQEPEAG